MTKRIPVLQCLLSGAVAFGGAYFLGHSRDQPEGVRPGNRGELSGPAATGYGLSKGEDVKSEPLATPGSGSVAVPSLGALLAEIKARGGSLEEEHLAVMEAIMAASVPQLESWLEQELDILKYNVGLRSDFPFAITRFAELAPERGVAFWTKHSDSDFVAGAILVPWAKRDPKAFGAWLEGVSPDLQKAAAGVLDRLGRQNPGEFARMAPQLASLPAGVSAAQTTMEEFFPKAGVKDAAKADPAIALAYANELPEGPLRNRALATLARWPGLKLEQYPAILAAVGELDAVRALEWGRNMAGFADKLPPGPARGSALAEASKREVKSDPVAAAARLEKMAGSPDYASAVLGFVRGSAGKDPAAAAEWALSIAAESGRHRQVALETVATAWFKANPGEARAWVEQAPLSGPEYFQLTGRLRAK